MKTIIALLAANLALSACLAPTLLPTVDEVCALPIEARAPLIEIMHSTAAKMDADCAIIKLLKD